MKRFIPLSMSCNFEKFKQDGSTYMLPSSVGVSTDESRQTEGHRGSATPYSFLNLNKKDEFL